MRIITNSERKDAVTDGKNCNFYRALYRANILYFSLYVGKQFEEFLIENEIYKKMIWYWILTGNL